MIWTTVKKEILHNLFSFKFTIVFLLLAILISSSTYIMYNDYVLRKENYDVLLPKENKKIAVIPPTPLSIFVKGLDETMGKSYRIQFGGQIEPGRTQQSVNAIFSLFITPDMMYIVKIILSLCAIIFSFDIISGEKSSNTLSLSLSNSINRTKFLTGKWIGGFATLIVPFFMMFLIALVAVLFSPHVQLRQDDWAKIGLFLLSAVMYAAFFFSLGAIISANTLRPPSSLVVSLFAWTLIVFVAPNLGNTVARQIQPVQSISQFEMKRSQIWIREIFKFSKSRGKGYNPDAFGEVLDRIDADNDMVRNDFIARFTRLTDTARSITRISPSAAFTYFATDIACTGVREDERLKQAVIRYKDTVVNNSGNPTNTEEILPDDVPRFSFSRRTASEIMSDEGFLNLEVLALLTIAAFAAAYVSFLRYDVR